MVRMLSSPVVGQTTFMSSTTALFQNNPYAHTNNQLVKQMWLADWKNELKTSDGAE